MKRTTITLSDALAAALQREAQRRNSSASEIARDAIASHLGLTGEAREIPFAAIGASRHSTTARDMEELLSEEWDDDARGR